MKILSLANAKKENQATTARPSRQLEHADIYPLGTNTVCFKAVSYTHLTLPTNRLV